MQAFGLNHPNGQFMKMTVPDPIPRHGQLVIQPAAIGLNNRDRAERFNAPDGRFTIIGHDVAGTVVDAGTTDFKVGQRVLAHTDHAYAELVLATPDTAVLMPQSLTLDYS
jgi:NADPH:quinone reductase-like Zn-dependent oxidoreductase